MKLTRAAVVGARRTRTYDDFESVYMEKPRVFRIYPRKPKNRGNAGAGMKAKEFLKRVDTFFPGGGQ